MITDYSIHVLLSGSFVILGSSFNLLIPRNSSLNIKLSQTASQNIPKPTEKRSNHSKPSLTEFNTLAWIIIRLCFPSLLVATVPLFTKIFDYQSELSSRPARLGTTGFCFPGGIDVGSIAGIRGASLHTCLLSSVSRQ